VGSIALQSSGSKLSELIANLNASIKGRMDSITGTSHIIKNLDIDGNVKQGRLLMNVNADYFNQDTGSLKLAVDGSVVPPTVRLETAFEDLKGSP